ncbi:MAG: type II secretion system protein [bacterium]
MRKAFSFVEILVVIAIVAIVTAAIFLNFNSKNNAILRSDAEKIFNFLKNMQVAATKLSPMITLVQNISNPTLMIGGLPNNPNRFEMRFLSLRIVNQTFVNVNTHLFNYATFQELNPKVNVTANVIPQQRFNLYANLNNEYPISLVGIIFTTDRRRVLIGFRTDGSIALPTNIQGGNMDINISMNGVNRRYMIRLQDRQLNFQLQVTR